MTTQPSVQAWLSADTVFEGGDWSQLGTFAQLDALVSDAAGETWRAVPRSGPIEALVATVVFDTDDVVQALNKRFRSIDKATNVLSFPATPLPRGVALGEHEPRHIGDVILAFETVLREAEDLGIPPAHHLQHLTVHGLLHLLGYDHLTDQEAEVMEALETSILAKLGVPDPYADSDPLPP